MQNLFVHCWQRVNVFATKRVTKRCVPSHPVGWWKSLHSTTKWATSLSAKLRGNWSALLLNFKPRSTLNTEPTQRYKDYTFWIQYALCNASEVVHRHTLSFNIRFLSVFCFLFLICCQDIIIFYNSLLPAPACILAPAKNILLNWSI